MANNLDTRDNGNYRPTVWVKNIIGGEEREASDGARLELLLDAVHTPSGAAALPALIDQAERAAREHDAEAILTVTHDDLTSRGYLTVAAPSLTALLYAPSGPTFSTDLTAWRLPLLALPLLVSHPS